MDSIGLNITRYTNFIFLLALLIGCQPSYVVQNQDPQNNIQVGDQYQADSAINAIISPYKAKLAESMNLIIGKAAITLDNSPGSGESLLGNFVADLMLERAESKFGSNLDMAIINAHGGLRTSINKGDIEVKDIYELMPFENSMVVLELDGNLVAQFFERCAKTKRNNIAGARFLIKDNKAFEIKINHKVFDKSATYTLAISDYLANGGGGFHFLKDAKVIADLDYKVRDMIIDQIKLLTSKSQEITASWDQRIQIIN